MLKIENDEVVGWEHAIRGMRNPKNSWEKSDSYFDLMIDDDKAEDFVGKNDQKLMMTLRNAGPDHRKFMHYIIVYLDITAPLYWWKEFEAYRAGVYPGQEPINPMDIEMNSCSTTHMIHAKEFTLDDFSCEHLMDCLDGDYEAYNNSPGRVLRETIVMLNMCRDLYLQTKDKKYWWQMIQLLPSSYNQKRTVMLNYEVLANMYKSRRNHKLDEWHTLCDWMETLPYSELITWNAARSEWSEQDLYKIAIYIQTIDPRIKYSNSYVKVATNHNICDFVVDDKVLYSFDMAKATVMDAIDFIRDFVDTAFERTLEFGA